MRTFEQVFGSPAAVTAHAPGRVNMLGEHTDYNDGYVLPTAIPQKTAVAMRKSGNDVFRVYADAFDDTAVFTFGAAPEEQFASYVFGCIRELAATGVNVPPLDIHVRSHVPIGVGLSSSAALEVATFRAARELLKVEIDDVQIARLAQRAELLYAGVKCGIMDQMASSLADVDHMLFLDTRTLERKLIELPEGAEILVIDSGVTRSLAGSKYNERREECEHAAKLLGVAALRDVQDPAASEELPEPYRRRARHVITENNRVLSALRGVTAQDFGELMNASHYSLRDDFEVSVPPLDELTELLRRHPAVFGARLTGAGFGGACVALCKRGEVRAVAHEVTEVYMRAGNKGRVLVPDEAG